MNKETITQSIARIEQHIYSSPYDDLTDYLQGVRDMLNLINGEENNKEIAAAHAAGKYIDLAKALDGISTPLHSGAVKYYKEKNIKIPDKIMPVK